MSSADFEAIGPGDMAAVTGGGTLHVARVFGGGSAPNGYSWTPVENLGPDYRSKAGLPNANTMDGVVSGTVDERDIIQRRAALPLDGNPGGMPELIINPAHVNTTGITALGAPM